MKYELRRENILLCDEYKRHGMDIKLTNSYKLVSFNIVVVTTYKRCHTVTIKLTNLCYLKTYELKALDCL
ncbi:hypothetical protein BAU24_03020 [Bacillus sp. L27]|nr:hypothetical protein BAU24_03020 [Bacillus sp. L27]